MRDPLRVELDDVGLQFLDPPDVGILGAIIVDGDLEAMRAQRPHEGMERGIGMRALFRHLAHDARRIDIGLVQHEPHVAQRLVDDLVFAEQRRIEIDEHHHLGIEAGAGVQEMQGAGQRLDVKPVGGRHAVEELARRNRLAIAERSDESLERGDGKFSRTEREDRLEGRAKLVCSPDSHRRSVVLPDDMSQANTARHGTDPRADCNRLHTGTEVFTLR